MNVDLTPISLSVLGRRRAHGLCCKCFSSFSVWGLRTQPWGVLLKCQITIFTTCGLLVRSEETQPQIPELGDQSKGNYGVECRSEINEQQTCIVPL